MLFFWLQAFLNKKNWAFRISKKNLFVVFPLFYEENVWIYVIKAHSRSIVLCPEAIRFKRKSPVWIWNILHNNWGA